MLAKSREYQRKWYAKQKAEDPEFMARERERNLKKRAKAPDRYRGYQRQYTAKKRAKLAEKKPISVDDFDECDEFFGWEGNDDE